VEVAASHLGDKNKNAAGWGIRASWRDKLEADYA
jgi:hypothetical protein